MSILTPPDPDETAIEEAELVYFRVSSTGGGSSTEPPRRMRRIRSWLDEYSAHKVAVMLTVVLSSVAAIASSIWLVLASYGVPVFQAPPQLNLELKPAERYAFDGETVTLKRIVLDSSGPIDVVSAVIRVPADPPTMLFAKGGDVCSVTTVDEARERAFSVTCSARSENPTELRLLSRAVVDYRHWVSVIARAEYGDVPIRAVSAAGTFGSPDGPALAQAPE